MLVLSLAIIIGPKFKLVGPVFDMICIVTFKITSASSELGNV